MKYNSPNVSPLFSTGNKMFLLLIALLSLIGNGYAQNPAVNVFEDWNTTSGTQNNFQRSIVRSKGIGGATYYYLCGSTINSSGNYDFLIQKKNTSGVVLWSQTYNGSGNGNDYAADVQIDAVGNVYICGTYYKNSTDSNNAVLIKYNNSGTHQWTQVFNGAGSGHDALAAIQLTSDGILVAGTTWQNSTDMYDMLVMRYDTTGSLIWSQNWDYNDLNDIAVNLYSSRSRIYVAGGVQSAATTYKYGMFTVLYSDGSYQGSMTAGGTAFGFDQLTAIQYDDSGYVYLTGGVMNVSTGYDIKTIKLDTLLNTVWSVTYTSAGVNSDVGTGLALDSAGNIFVTGYKTSATSGKDYVTIKYSSGGTQRWASTFDGGINADDSATAIVVNSADTNKIYVTGFSYNGSTKDYWTIKYDGAGNQKWDIGFNNLNNGDDRATAIALDTLGNIIVTGQNKLNDSTHSYTTVKYIEKSTLLPDDTISFTSGSFVFSENEGQLMGTDTATHPEVKFYTMRSSPNVFFMDTAVAYVFTRIDTSSTNMDTLMRVDMKFVNSNSGQRIRPLDVRSEYSNFFLSHIPEGRCKVQNYNQLVSFNVWNNVDVVYGSNLRGLKHYFVCKPGGGGNPATQIDLLYEGADSVALGASGELIIYTPLGTIIQPKAAAWQLDASGNYSALAWQPNYQILGPNEVGFTAFGSYNAALPIIIAADWGPPTTQSCVTGLPWSTFMGGTSLNDQFNDMVVNSTGEVFVCGKSASINFPFLSGLYTHVGGEDAVVVDFHPGGALRWSTYFGGDVTPTGASGANESATSIDVSNSAGVLVIVGVTNSGSDLPCVPWGNYNQTVNGGTSTCTGGNCNDQFIARLSSNGQMLLYCSYYGGPGYDIAYSVSVSNATVNQDQICMVGAGGAGFPVFNSTWTTVGSSIAKWNANGNRTWSAMSLGNANCAIYANDYDAFGNVIVVGSTGTTTFVTTSGVQQQIYGGGLSDAFVTKISTSNAIDWSTFLGGNGADIAWDIVTSEFGSAPEYFVTGNTTSTTGGAFPTTPGGVPISIRRWNQLGRRICITIQWYNRGFALFNLSRRS